MPRPIEVPPAVLAGAAATLAAVPGATVPKVAEALGLSPATLTRRLRDNPDLNTTPLRAMDSRAAEIAARAKQAADLAATELAGPDLPTVAQASDRAAVTVAVDVTQRVLERHRKEWEVPRGLLAEALNRRKGPGGVATNETTSAAFEAMKLAKISAETLTLVQQGERTAHGIKAGDVPTTIEIERE